MSKKNIKVVAYPVHGADNDPKLLFFGGMIFLGVFCGGGGRGWGGGLCVVCVCVCVLVFHHQGSTFLQWAIWE